MRTLDRLPDFKESEKMHREADRIMEIIEKREGGKLFRLPLDFDSRMSQKEEKEISGRFEALQNDLNRRGFEIILAPNAPLKALYLYAVHVSLLTEGLSVPGQSNIVFGNCTGWCEECFQKSWCTTPDEIDEEELDDLPLNNIRSQKIGRNDPCPCGSGKKYKKCCMGKMN